MGEHRECIVVNTAHIGEASNPQGAFHPVPSLWILLTLLCLLRNLYHEKSIVAGTNIFKLVFNVYQRMIYSAKSVYLV